MAGRSRAAARAPAFVVGIDLGTTHCAVAYSPASRSELQLFDVPQVLAPGEVGTRRLLPSFTYLPAPGEFAPGALSLPWGDDEPLVGEWARRHGAEVPTRSVASAKSWICHGGVNRRAPILPWSAPDSDAKLSPFDAQVQYLSHLRKAWDHAHAGAPLAEQDVVVTVPASFDEVARELVSDAARKAGLPHIRLLEEPQAAFYDFLGTHEGDLRAQMGDARLVLVVDVGGGTTDLTLLKVLPEPGPEGEPILERIAVGGHLMLGGDNMDAALAHHVQQEAGLEGKLDPSEWSQLIASARQAKERLLAEEAPAELSLAIRRRGARLLGGTRTVPVSREQAEALLVDGFVPRTRADEVAEATGRAGLTTMGLPYTSDPAIPRHIAAFLRRHESAARAAGAHIEGGLPRPDRLLVNGGVFHAPALLVRLQDVMAGWFGAPVPLLPHTSLDTAVARGAARFALAKRGVGRVIGGGAARAYYVGVAGDDGKMRALCVAPKGMEEGQRVEVTQRTFELVVNQSVQFPLYAYSGDRVDHVGTIVDTDPATAGRGDRLEVLPPLETLIRQKGDLWVNPESGGVPVRLEATLAESGTLALSLVTLELPPRRFGLKLTLAPAPTADSAEPGAGGPAEPPPAGAAEAPLEPLPKAFGEARRALDRPFGLGRFAANPEAVQSLRAELEAALGPRGEWSPSVCRALFDALFGVVDRRGRSAAHELNWLRLLSFAIRPGLGVEGDRERVAKLWELHALGLKHPEDKSVQAEWWILWRRVAPALSASQQRTLFDEVDPWLSGQKPPKGVPPAHGHAEMIRMLAALERLSPLQKQRAADHWRRHFKKVSSYWALGRLGARELLFGEPAEVVPPEVAATWLESLFELDWKRADGAAFAALLLARVTGDARRDLPEALRKRVRTRLRDVDAPAPWLEMLAHAGRLSESDARRSYGEALPPGLRLG